MKIYKKVVFGEELHKTCKQTMNMMAKAVKATLGPSGKLALVDRGEAPSLITKDGVTVCKSTLPIQDEAMNKIGEKIKEIAVKTNQEAGDGTTTSIVLAEALYNESLKHIESDVDPVVIKEEIEKALPAILKELKEISTPIETLEDMENVASISANNDRSIGRAVAEAMEVVGEDGFVTLQESDSLEPTIETIEGMQIDKGVSNPKFLNDKNNLEFEEPIIFAFEGKIEDPQILHNIYESYVKGKPFIVMGSLSDQCLNYLLVNSQRGLIKGCHIQPPMHGQTRHNILVDITTVIDSKLANTAFDDMISLPIEYLGSCERLNVNLKKTTIMNGNGEDETIFARIEQLKEDLKKAKAEYDRDIIKERIGMLACGVAIIGVDGKTDDEMKERKDRFEDSLNATRAALMEGVVEGGGFTLYKIAQNLKGDSIGEEILKTALEAPIKQIILNTGRDPNKILEGVTDNKGYDARNDKFVNLEEAGIIDPTKVISSALQNAISIVDLLINLEVLTAIIKENESPFSFPGM